MAGIDKIYCPDYPSLLEWIDWASKNKFKYPNGVEFQFIHEFELTEDSFKDGEIPILNTSGSDDYYLIKYCTVGFVQKRMREVYSTKYIQSILDGTSSFDNPRPRGNKIKVLYYTPFRRDKRLNELSAILPDGTRVWYNSFDNYWTPENELGESDCIIGWKRINSFKSLIRQVRKWNLPKGTILACNTYGCNRYVYENYLYAKPSELNSENNVAVILVK